MKISTLPLLAGFGLLVGLVGCRSTDQETRLLRKDITETIFASGELDVDQAYFLVAQVEGVLKDTRFQEGSSVQAGEVLAVIDNRINQLAEQNAQEQYALARQTVGPSLKQLAAQWTAAKQKASFDSLQAVRYRRLLASEAVPRLEAERAELTYAASQKAQESLQEQYQTLRIQADQQVVGQRNQAQVNRVLREYNQVVAPEKGKVLQKFKQKGDYVRKGDVLARIGSPEQLYARLSVDEASIAQVTLGQTVQIRLNTHPDTLWTGEVMEILPTFDAARQSYTVKARLRQAPSSLLVGTQLEANVVVRHRSQVRVIPRVYLGYGQTVWKKGDDSPSTIQTGFISDQWVEVKAGLDSSDVLILPKR